MSTSKKPVGSETEEPVTPAGRMFLHPKMDQVINTVIGLQNPIDLPATKEAIKDSIMAKHPRFRSLLFYDKHGREHWRKLDEVDIDKHVFEVELERELSSGVNGEDDEAVINEYLADLSVSTPLKMDKPLWELHVLKEQKCYVLRIHHSLGDGVSLMSLFLTCCRRVGGDGDELPNVQMSNGGVEKKKKKMNGFEMVWRFVVVFVLTLVYVLKFVLRSLWVNDEKTVVSGGNGVELWPRKIASAKFDLEDMKLVKNAVPSGTINDALFAVISSGLTRYLDLRSPKKTKEGLQITGLAMVNIRKQPGLLELSNLMRNESSSRWGNQFGFVLLPLYYHQEINDPLCYVTRAKTMLDHKKLSLEAFFSYRIGKIVMSTFGPKLAAMLNYRILCNTTYTISNIIGPQEELMFAGNPITYIRVNGTSLPQGITMHMVSYNGTAYMQINVPKDIIPDPEVLAKCFQDSLFEMKNAAIASKKAEGAASNVYTKDS